MTADPLEKFRKISPDTPPEPPYQEESGEGLPEYRAFEAKDKNRRLQIRRVHGATHCPAYSYLLNISYDGEYGTEIVLTYSFMQVKIKGKNLQMLIISLLKNGCTFIQDFDPQYFATPEPNEAFIEWIEVITRDGEGN